MSGHRIRSKAQETERRCSYCPRTFTREEHLRRHERTHTGEKPFKCHKCHRKYSRSDVLARHLQSHPCDSAAGTLSKATIDPDQASLPDKRDSLFLDKHQLPTPATGLAHPDQCSSINDHHTVADPARNPTLDPAYASSRQDSTILAPVLEIHLENSPSLDNAVSNGSNDSVAEKLSIERPTGAQLRPGQRNANVQEPSKQQGQQLSSQGRDRMLLLSQSGIADIDFSLVDAGFDGYNPLTPGIWDMFDFAAPPTPELAPHDVAEETVAKPDTLFSEHQIQRMRHLWWCQRPTRGIRLGPSLWRTVVQHPGDSIFSDPYAAGRMEPNADSQGISGGGVDEDCRTAMICFCKRLDEEGYYHSLADFTPHSTSRGDSSPVAEHEHPMPMSATDGFPSRELVEASIDAFFQYAPLPFLHKTTFDAGAIPVSLLLPILFIGLSSLYPERSRPFVLRYLKVAFQPPIPQPPRAREMASKALGSISPSDLLVSTASTLLVVYLSLGYPEDLDECAAHMLCAQMLHVVEKHGIFTTSDQDDLVFQLHAGPSDPEDSWKSWVRVESIKRMISCLLWMDMAYTRLMGTAGVVDIDKVEIYQPCEDALFDAPNATLFRELVKRGSQVMMPSVTLHNSHASGHPTPAPGHFVIETSLVAWYLQIAAIRHRLPMGYHLPLEARSRCPAEMLSECCQARDVITSILTLPSQYANLFLHRHTISSGRDGPESAQSALAAVSKWAQAPAARRAALHAAQIYNILSSSRPKESYIARPDLLLFNSGLVLSMYLFISSRERDRADQDHNTLPSFELLDEVDWTTLGQEGLLISQSGPLRSVAGPGPRSDTQTLNSHAPASAWAACNFIRRGGPVSFAGEVQRGSEVTARKILLNYGRLLDDFGRWRGSRYSRLLRAMSDLIVEGNR
ncbi:hypothetical protein BJY01DRAFT_248186 [Aspergillus pseudoustus]|uniref:C2H2-type domain-containing protein n=1 Tax=Aspergillus pseudoustus TaxID=1810923 RepID=A0ABR4JWD5_9EURO